MLVNGHGPDSMMLATMVLKNLHKSMVDSNNYRAITLNSIIGKVLDWVGLQYWAAQASNLDSNRVFLQLSIALLC